MLATADSRAILMNALQRRLVGEQVADIDALVPCPIRLNQAEKSAWLMLHTWNCDEPLRASSASHAAYTRDRLQHLINVLQ